MRMFAPSAVDFARLDALVEKLITSGRGDQHDLLVEHLQAAHAYSLGAMPEECEHNLEMALQAADDLPEKELRNQAREVIRKLLAPESQIASAHPE